MDMVNLLRDHGIAPTLQRLEIASALFSDKRHVTAEQLLEEINLGSNPVSRATLYNTLRLMSAKGLVRELIVDPARVVYEPRTTDHHHIYDVTTGELMDFDAESQWMTEALRLPSEFELIGIDVIVRVRGARGRRLNTLTARSDIGHNAFQLSAPES
ncbi:MAG: transcriptional repressor [Nitrospinae bacterium]|nr:transcriptional repressor [Nitrospinota bacterium]